MATGEFQSFTNRGQGPETRTGLIGRVGRVRRRRLTDRDQAQFDRDYRGSSELPAEYWESWRRYGLGAERLESAEEKAEGQVLLRRARKDWTGAERAEQNLANIRRGSEVGAGFRTMEFNPERDSAERRTMEFDPDRDEVGLVKLGAESSEANRPAQSEPSKPAQSALQKRQTEAERNTTDQTEASSAEPTVDALGFPLPTPGGGQMKRGDASGPFGVAENDKLPDGVLHNPNADGTNGWSVIRPKDKNLPSIAIPRAKGQEPFRRGEGSFLHQYDQSHPVPGALGQEGLEAVGEALKQNPTPGEDSPASSDGTVNDAGEIIKKHLHIVGNDENMVRTYVVPNPNSGETDYVINYTISGEHELSDGYVMRYGKLDQGGGVTIRTYGEGNAWQQGVPGVEQGSDYLANLEWERNANEIGEAIKKSRASDE